MESYQRESLSSGEMVRAARRQVLGREGATASEEMVAAAHDRVNAMGADPGAEYPAAETAVVGSSSMSDDWIAEAPPRRAPTRVDGAGRRQSQEVSPSPFEVTPRRVGRVGVLAGLALVGFAVAALVSPITEWFDTLRDNDVSPSAVSVVTAPGAMLVSVDTMLEQDHAGEVIIGSSDVTLDCAGHTITGSGQRVGVAVFDVNDVTVANCTVEGFEAGIVVINSQRSAIEGNAVLDSPVGVVVMESSQIAVVDNTVATPDRGIQVVNTRDSEIAANESSGSAVGFDVIDATGNTFAENRSVGSDFSAFSVTNADGNVFEANEVESSHFGFVVTSSNDNTFDANAVSRGFGWFSFGFQERSEGNTVTNNQVTGGGLAFKVYIGSARNTFADNVASHTAKGVSIDSGCVGNVVERNTITGAREIGLQDTSRGGTGDLGTDNIYRGNQCRDNATASQPWGLCEL
jgi:parallel beta-helix repeat protein